ncbi:coiled-coil domain-containing protein 149-like isoform X2 [Tubulanus polymorphus]|uniref:coiled-coil domain-containing protein 149-like isoform X2 n=1 Tax=Tubulanus polymorphus TaxID=672921 RepID=UPI003DA67751
MNLFPIQRENEGLKTELSICQRKLDSKCEALLILSGELDQCRSERDQFKLMAEQLRERYQDLKRQVTGKSPGGGNNYSEPESNEVDRYGGKNENLSLRLYQCKDANKCLQFEVDDLKQKLNDAQGDIKLLREQIARQRVGTTDEGMNTRHFPAYEREDLVKQLEAKQEKFLQLERDLQQVLDEKEELVTERDTYKNKYDRLNIELNYVLKGDEKRIVDIDAMSMENRYLKERLNQMEEEKSMAMATVTKYKSILEKKKNRSGMKIGQNRSGGVVISQKQVQQLLDSTTSVQVTAQALSDLQGLARALLESLNDKTLALSHQRKTNKILGTRVAELEKKLKTLEVSGLWNIPGRAPSLEKMRLECDEIKTLIPNAALVITGERSDVSTEIGSDLELSSSESTPEHRLTKNHNAGICLEDLDLLPTKEETCQDVQDADLDSVLSPLINPCNDKLPIICERDYNSSKDDTTNPHDNHPRSHDEEVIPQKNEELITDNDEDDEENYDSGDEQLQSLLGKATSKLTSNNETSSPQRQCKDSNVPSLMARLQLSESRAASGSMKQTSGLNSKESSLDESAELPEMV